MKAMHLVYQCLENKSPPDSLPLDLIPPHRRGISFAPLVPPASTEAMPAAVAPPQPLPPPAAPPQPLPAPAAKTATTSAHEISSSPSIPTPPPPNAPAPPAAVVPSQPKTTAPASSAVALPPSETNGSG